MARLMVISLCAYRLRIALMPQKILRCNHSHCIDVIKHGLTFLSHARFCAAYND